MASMAIQSITVTPRPTTNPQFTALPNCAIDGQRSNTTRLQQHPVSRSHRRRGNVSPDPPKPTNPALNLLRNHSTQIPLAPPLSKPYIPLMPPTTPSPWKSLTRFLVHSLCVLFLATILWFLWDTYASHKLNSRIAMYRAHGEPISAADLAAKNVSPHENGYDFAMSADHAMTLTADEHALLQERTLTSLSPAQMETAKKLLAESTATLKLLTQMRQVPHSVLPVDWSNLAFGSFDVVQPLEHLANFCRVLAFLHHQQQRDDLAFQDIQTIHALAQIMQQAPTPMIAMATIRAYGVEAWTILHIAPALQIQEASTPQGAARSDVISQIRNISTIQPLQDGYVNAVRAERIIALQLFAPMDKIYLLRPMFRLGICRAFDDDDTVIDALCPGIPSYPVVREKSNRRFTSAPWKRSDLQSLEHLVGDLSSPDYATTNLIVYHTMTDCEAASVSLAIHLYATDHTGHLPPSLTALIPDYLPTAPRDLFRADAASLTYVPERRLFYSVGVDGVDNGGKASPAFAEINRNALDIVYSLDK
jgi:hypothetical protein